MSPSPAFLGHIPFTIQPVSPSQRSFAGTKRPCSGIAAAKSQSSLAHIRNRRETASTQTQEDNQAEAIRLLDLEWKRPKKDSIPQGGSRCDGVPFHFHPDGSDLARYSLRKPPGIMTVHC